MIMDHDYLSIKEFSDIVGVSHQSIYKRLNNYEDELRNYMREIDGRKMLDAAAIALYQPKMDDSTSCNQGAQPVATLDNELRNEYIEFLKSELAAKNEQISQLQQLLHQEQQLRLVADQKILMLESNESKTEPPAEPIRKWWQFWK